MPRHRRCSHSVPSVSGCVRGTIGRSSSMESSCALLYMILSGSGSLCVVSIKVLIYNGVWSYSTTRRGSAVLQLCLFSIYIYIRNVTEPGYVTFHSFCRRGTVHYSACFEFQYKYFMSYVVNYFVSRDQSQNLRCFNIDIDESFSMRLLPYLGV